MRFALLGVHPDGISLAQALVESGRHRLLIYTNAVPGSLPDRWGQEARRVNDLEEILANPEIEAIIVASPAPGRPTHLRRALQSERHVFCVYPPDQAPEIAYEAAMIRNDTGFLLFPLLPDLLHPALDRLKVLMEDASGPLSRSSQRPPLLELEWSDTGPVLFNTGIAGHKPSFPGWDILRRLGGEIAEVSGFAGSEEVPEEEPVLIAGRFEQGGLFRLTLLPHQPASSCRLTLVASRGRAELLCPEGWRGSARLTWMGPEAGAASWESWHPWPAVVDRIERTLERLAVKKEVGAEAWQDAVRMLELDDAARRSIEKRRSSLLEYPDPNEEVGFKGTMTLVGCGVLWLVIFLLILSRWMPQIGLLAVPMLAGFLLLQLFRYALPAKSAKAKRLD